MKKEEIDFSALDAKNISNKYFTKGQLEKVGLGKGKVRIITNGFFILMIGYWLFEVIVNQLWPLLIFVIGAITVYFAIGFFNNKAKKRFFKFALDNGWEADFYGAELNPMPLLFSQHGTNQGINYYLKDPRDGTVFSDCSYTIYYNQKKNSRTYHFKCAQVKLPRPVPHLILNARNSYGVDSSDLVGVTTLKLEGDFNHFFKLIVPLGYERDALQILTPDVMETLKEFAVGYDIELLDDNLFLIGPENAWDDSESFRHLYRAAKKLRDEFSFQVKKYSDERVSTTAFSQENPEFSANNNSLKNQVTEKGRRITTKKINENLITILSATFIIGIFLFVFVNIIMDTTR